MAVVIDLPFATLGDLPGVLRTSACAGPVVTIHLAAENALRLARMIERDAVLQMIKWDAVQQASTAAAQSDDVPQDAGVGAAVWRLALCAFLTGAGVTLWIALAVWWLA